MQSKQLADLNVNKFEQILYFRADGDSKQIVVCG